MSSTTRMILRGGIAVAAAAGLAAGAGLAGAQIPGANTGGHVVKVDSNALLVTVNDTAPNAAQVTGSVRNATGNNFRCGVPAGDAELPGQATTAQVVSLAMDHYARSIYSGTDGFDIPMVGDLNTGSLDDILPGGGSSNLFGSSGADDVDVTTAQQQARVAGRTGDPLVGGNVAFNVNAGQTVNWTASMAVSSTGDRGDWQAAAMFYCIDQVTNQHYVFAGYEGLEPGESPEPVVSDDSGSLSMGSLGS